jgi:Fe-S cluster assembly iron-binding protein IscA
LQQFESADPNAFGKAPRRGYEFLSVHGRRLLPCLVAVPPDENHKEDHMVQVTEQAASAIQELLAEYAAPPQAGVRLTPSAGGNIGIVIAEPEPGDEVLTRDETPLLIVDGAVAPGLTDMVVDFKDVTDDHQQSGGFLLRPKDSGE